MIGLHPYYYFQEAWNCFDAIIVCFSLLEFALANVKGFAVLRTFRLVSLLKAKYEMTVCLNGKLLHSKKISFKIVIKQ